MTKIILKLFFGFVLLAVVITELACSTSGPVVASEMTHGEKLYRARCANCHRLRAPHENTSEEWALNVEKYGKKMSPQQKQLVLDYLLTDAKRARDL